VFVAAAAVYLQGSAGVGDMWCGEFGVGVLLLPGKAKAQSGNGNGNGKAAKQQQVVQVRLLA
jgi:hypothetical protein